VAVDRCTLGQPADSPACSSCLGASGTAVVVLEAWANDAVGERVPWPEAGK